MGDAIEEGDAVPDDGSGGNCSSAAFSWAYNGEWEMWGLGAGERLSLALELALGRLLLELVRMLRDSLSFSRRLRADAAEGVYENGMMDNWGQEILYWSDLDTV